MSPLSFIIIKSEILFPRRLLANLLIADFNEIILSNALYAKLFSKIYSYYLTILINCLWMLFLWEFTLLNSNRIRASYKNAVALSHQNANSYVSSFF